MQVVAHNGYLLLQFLFSKCEIFYTDSKIETPTIYICKLGSMRVVMALRVLTQCAASFVRTLRPVGQVRDGLKVGADGAGCVKTQYDSL